MIEVMLCKIVRLSAAKHMNNALLRLKLVIVALGYKVTNTFYQMQYLLMHRLHIDYKMLVIAQQNEFPLFNPFKRGGGKNATTDF